MYDGLLIFCSFLASNGKGLSFTYYSTWLMTLSKYTASGFYFGFLNKGRKDGRKSCRVKISQRVPALTLVLERKGFYFTGPVNVRPPLYLLALFVFVCQNLLVTPSCLHLLLPRLFKK